MSETEQSIRKAVAAFEDDNDVIRSLKFTLSFDGIELFPAQNMADARALIQQLEELKIPVVFIDGNLSRGDRSNYDGRQLVKETREQAPMVITVNYASGGSIGADVDHLGKGDGPRPYMELLEKIFNGTFKCPTRE